MLPTSLPLSIFLLGAAVAPVFAADTTCSPSQKCPKDTPCCSQYGVCGVGAYCLGGCDPRASFSLDACTPEPVCVSKTLNMKDAKIVQAEDYLGDATKADFVAQGTPLPYGDDILMTMPKYSAGTVLASSTYMWYGNISATMKTSRGAGVITAFILLSDVKDEIDYEFVGVDLLTAQTNYYWQAVLDYHNSGNITVSNSTFDNYHTYEIQWTPDTITWLVDGKAGRVKKRSDTWNATTNQWDYPQTPARIQFSIWPGGNSTNPQGTIDWAGGAIDWNSQDIQSNGYDYAAIRSVSMSCYQTTTPPGTNSGVSYTYSDASGVNSTVIDGTKGTILESLLGTGLDMNKTYPSASGSASSTASEVAVIPGLSGGGPGTNGQAGTSAASSGGTSATGTSPAAAATCSGFSQNCGSSSGSGTKNEGVRQERMLGASAFAALIAVAGMLWL